MKTCSNIWSEIAGGMVKAMEWPLELEGISGKNGLTTVSEAQLFLAIDLTDDATFLIFVCSKGCSFSY